MSFSDDGDEVPTANTAVVLGEASAPVAIELKSACFIGSSIGVESVSIFMTCLRSFFDGKSGSMVLP